MVVHRAEPEDTRSGRRQATAFNVTRQKSPISSVAQRPGYFYLAHSELRNLVKVGFSEIDPDQRVTWLQSIGYGGLDDWVIVKSLRILRDAGKCEFDIHRDLEQWRRPIHYMKNNVEVECREIFACRLPLAQDVYDRIVNIYQ